MHDALLVTLPGEITRRATPLVGETVADFVARAGWPTTTLPTICALNGAPLLRGEWAGRALCADDELIFLARPMGGRAQSKQVMGLVAMIGLSMLAPGVGSLLGEGIIGALGKAAFLMGGAFAVSTLVAVNAGGDDSGDGDTIYSFGQQTNSAALLQTIPVSYGRVRKTPTYAAVPWFEYSGNEQYLNVLLCQGLGKYATKTIYVDDTVLWTADGGFSSNFTDVEAQFAGPGEEVTLFPVNVATSSEVSGQELDVEWAGGFVSAPSGTITTAIALDISGVLYWTNDNGEISTYYVQLIAQYRPVDDLGLPTGSGEWQPLINPSLSNATKKARRWTFKAEVPAGRYEVRLRRGSAPSTTSSVSDTIAWAGLRAFLTGGNSFAGVSTIALRMKATQQLTDGSATNIDVVDSRILPVHDGTGWVEQETRSPAWAFYDMATNADYGAKRSPSKVDLQTIFSLDALATSRGDCFDYEFSSAVSVPEAFDTALATIRAKHRWSGDTLTLVRDEWHDVPSMLITDREIVRGTFSADYEMLPSDSVDAVICEYIDSGTWQVEEVQYPPDYSASNPKRVELKGVVQRDQAYREAGFYYRQHAYRRISPSFDMEHDGRLVSLGDQVLVQSDMPGAWGAAGAVVAQDEMSLTLEPAPTWAASGQHYVLLRTKTGAAFGPVKCSRGASAAECILDATDLASVEAGQGTSLAAVLSRRDGAELPTYAHGLGTSWQRRCIALTGAPSGDRVSLTFVVDDERVHQDDGVPDALPTLPALGTSAPVISGLIAQITQNVLEPVLTASWWAADGATSYQARISYDEGETWTPLPVVMVPELSAVVAPAALSLQVRGVGAKPGRWVQVDVSAPTIDVSVVTGDLQAYIDTQLVAAIEDVKAAQDRLATIVADVDAAARLAVDDASAEADAQIERANAALADAQATLSAAIEAANAQLALVRSDLDARIAAADAALSGAQSDLAAAIAAADARALAAEAALSAAVTGLEASVSAVDDRVDTVQADLATAVSGLTASVTAAQDGVDAVGAALGTAQDTLQANIDALGVTVSGNEAAASSAIAGLQTDVAGNTATIGALQETLSTTTSALAQDISGLQTDVAGNAATITDVETALSTLTSATASQVAGLQSQVEGARAEAVSGTATAVGPLQDELAALALQLADADAYARLMVDDAQAANAIQFERLSSEMGDASSSITVLQQTIATLDTASAESVVALEARIDGAEATVAGLQSTVAGLDLATAEQVSALSAAVAGNTSAIGSLEDVVAGIDTVSAETVAELQVQVAENASNITENASAIATLSGTTATQLTSLESQIGETNAVVSEVRGTSVGALQDQIDTLSLILADTGAAAHLAVDDALQSVAVQMESVRAAMGSSDASISTLQATVAAMDSASAEQIQQIQAQTASNAAGLAVVSSALTTLTTSTATSISGLQADVAGISSDLTIANTAIADLEASKAEASALMSLGTTVAGHMASLTALGDTVSDLESSTASSLSALQADVEGADANIGTLQTAVANLQTGKAEASTVTGLAATVASNAATIAGIDETVADLSSSTASSLSGLQADVDGVSAGLTTANATIADLEATKAEASALTSLEAAVADQGASVDALSTAVADLGTGKAEASTVAALSATVAGNSAAITALDTAMSDLESSTASSVEGLQAALDGASAVFSAGMSWEFSSTVEGWAAGGSTLSAAGGVLTQVNTSGSAYITSPAVTIAGAQLDKIRARIRRTSGTGAWVGRVSYYTAGHSFSASYYRIVSAPTAPGDWSIVEWDMAALTAGGADWASSTITAIRLYLWGDGDAVEIDWIAVGKRGVAADASQLSSVSATVASQGGAITSQASQIGTIETTVAGNTSAIGTLQTTVSGLSSSTATSISGLQADVGSIAADITDLQTATADLQSSKAEASTVSGISAAVDGHTAEIVGLQDTVASLTSGTASSLSALTAEMGDVQADVTSLQAATADLDTTKAEASALASLGTTVAGHTSSISGLTSSVSSLEASTAASVSALQAQVDATASFSAGISWEFAASAEGWTAAGSSISAAGGVLTQVGSSGSIYLTSGAVSITGAQHDKIRARIRRTAGTGAWQGLARYYTSGHSFGSAYQKVISAPATPGGWSIVEWDMAALTAGGGDWSSSTITSIRLYLWGTGDTVEIDWIAVGKRGVAADASQLSTLQSTVTTQGSSIAAQSAAISALQADVGDIAAEVNITAVATAAPSGAYSAYSVAVKGGPAGALVSGAFGVYVYEEGGAYHSVFAIQADRFIFTDAAGDHALFAIDASGAAYLDGDFFASGSITSDKIAAGAISAEKISAHSITADQITIGGITTDSLALGAVSSVVSATGVITNVGSGYVTLLSVSVNRAEGSIVSLSVDGDASWYTNTGQQGRYGTLYITRTNNGSSEIIKRIWLMHATNGDAPIAIYTYMNTDFGGKIFNMSFVDSDDISGDTVYALMAAPYNGAAIRFHGHTITAMEFKR